MRLYKPKDRWWLELRDHHRRIRRFAGFTDIRQTRAFGLNIEKLISCRASGDPPGPELMAWVGAQPDKLRKRFADMGLISNRQATATKSLEALLAEFRSTLLEGAGTEKQASLIMSRLRKIVRGCRAERWQDLTKKPVAEFIDGQYQSGQLSKRTCNFYVKHARRFGRWLTAELELKESPLAELQTRRFNRRKDQVHERRALTVDEAARLLEATQAAGPRFGLSGNERYILYRLAIESGLRRRELRALTRESFDFSGRTVTVLGDRTKNRQDAVLPMRKDTAAEIENYCRGLKRTGRLFAIPQKSAEMIKADCEAAGIEYVDDSGRYCDFHALRHSCGTLLAAAGVHPKTAQQIMRHSDIRLTMDFYTHFLAGQEHRAIEALPDLGARENSKRATGTDGQ